MLENPFKTHIRKHFCPWVYLFSIDTLILVFFSKGKIVPYFQYTNSIFSFNAPVCDISFAHTNSAFFGAIDEVGTILIFSLDQKKDQKSIHVSYI